MGSIQQAHKDKSLQIQVKKMMTYFSIMGSMLFAMITLPAMPIIFYMTILYNVIMVVVEFFRNL